MVTRMNVVSDVAGKVWKIEAPVGTAVSEGDVILILESMKMEIPVEAPASGTVADILVAEEDAVAEGQTVAILEKG